MTSISIALPTRGVRDARDLQRALAIAELADSAPGWDTVWVADSLLALPLVESMMVLSACAARTARVRLGVSCQATLGLREPLLLAAQWAAADLLSGGRVTLVACPGWGVGDAVERELRAFDLPFAEKTRRMERNIGILRRASLEGRYLAGAEDVELPTPFVQRPLPIWLAANPSESASARTVERLLDRVARLADGWMTYAVTPGTLRDRVEVLRALRAQHVGASGDPMPVVVSVNVNVDPDERRARRDARARWATHGTRNVAPDELERISAIGSPSQCHERICELVEAGATGIAVYPLSGDPLRQAELLTEHVLPLLNAGSRPSAPSVAAEARA